MTNDRAALQETKRADKKPAVSIIKPKSGSENATTTAVSPKDGSPRSVEEEMTALKARNHVLTEALKSIKETAESEAKKHYDLVWHARNKSRYPLHTERKRIEEEHSEELKKLETPDGDFHHGVHAGLLAASRMFQKQADILHVVKEIRPESASEEILTAAAKHKKAVEESRESFPNLAVTSPPNAASK